MMQDSVTEKPKDTLGLEVPKGIEILRDDEEMLEFKHKWSSIWPSVIIAILPGVAIYTVLFDRELFSMLILPFQIGLIAGAFLFLYLAIMIAKNSVVVRVGKGMLDVSYIPVPTFPFFRPLSVERQTIKSIDIHRNGTLDIDYIDKGGAVLFVGFFTDYGVTHYFLDAIVLRLDVPTDDTQTNILLRELEEGGDPEE